MRLGDSLMNLWLGFSCLNFWFLVFGGAGVLGVGDEELDVQVLDFGSKFFLTARSQSKNFVLSPVVLHSSLSILSMGLKPDSKLSQQLIKLLEYESLNGNVKPAHREYRDLMKRFRDLPADHEPSRDTSGHKLRMNFDHFLIVGLEVNLKKKFNNWIEKYYRVEAKVIGRKDRSEKQDFANLINGRAKAYGFSEELVNADKLIEFDKGLTVITNLFVSAGWQEIQFDRDHEAKFYNHGHASCKVAKALRSVPTDQIKVLQFSHDRKMSQCHHAQLASKPSNGISDFRAIRLSLDADISYTIIEPVDTSMHALDKLESELLKDLASPKKAGGGYLARVLEKLDDSEPVDVDYLVMPAFMTETKYDVKSLLVDKFNLGSLTSGGHISEMIEETNLNLDKYNHNAVIKISHRGAKGGGSSALADLGYNCKLKIERPFLYVIRHKKMPLYIGHLVKVEGL